MQFGNTLYDRPRWRLYRPLSVCAQWQFEFQWARLVEDAEVWNIALRRQMY